MDGFESWIRRISSLPKFFDTSGGSDPSKTLSLRLATSVPQNSPIRAQNRTEWLYDWTRDSVTYSNCLIRIFQLGRFHSESNLRYPATLYWREENINSDNSVASNKSNPYATHEGSTNSPALLVMFQRDRECLSRQSWLYRTNNKNLAKYQFLTIDRHAARYSRFHYLANYTDRAHLG